MRSLAEFAADLRRLPTVVAHQVAREAAPAITSLARESFDESLTPYGVPWVSGVEGQQVKLRKSGDLERQIRYVAVGSRLRVALGVHYARYQVGKRPVFPRQHGELPPSYLQALQRAAVRVIKREMRL